MEFGSDFHLLKYPEGNTFINYFPSANLYVSGRQALLALAIARKWMRLWIPSYFCEESLNCFKETGIKLIKYHCLPTDNPEIIINNLRTDKKDVVLVVNYFGLHSINEFRTNAEIVEDHTHDLIGDWSINSTADWCIASLRKTIPIADGGILWSPKKKLPNNLNSTVETERIMATRYDAMKRKTLYLAGGRICKSEFLNLFTISEESFDSIELSGISKHSKAILSRFDIDIWYQKKRNNYYRLLELINIPESIRILTPESTTSTPFSLCLLFPNMEYRDFTRKRLIAQSVYPAILWNIKSNDDLDSKSFGNRILSIHCDGRYSLEEIQLLADIINHSL